MNVPVSLLLGALGAGKTTVLNHLLAQRPPHERWAVVVNEFGVLGIDAALLAGHTDVLVQEVSGGCACCSAQMVFETRLVQLLRQGPWQRIFIEPSGQAHAGALIDSLRGSTLRKLLRLEHVITVLDASRQPGQFTDASRESLGAANVVVLNRIEEDGATREHWMRSIQPYAVVPAQVIAAPDGLVQWPRLLNSVALGASSTPMLTGTSAQRSEEAIDAGLGSEVTRLLHGGLMMRSAPGKVVSLAWWWPEVVRFDRRRVLAALEAISSQGGVLRIKAVFGSARQWQAWQAWRTRPGVPITTQSDEVAWRLDHRFEALLEEGVSEVNIEQWTALLQAALAPPEQ